MKRIKIVNELHFVAICSYTSKSFQSISAFAKAIAGYVLSEDINSILKDLH